jgi:hypothetical protein
MCIHRLGGTGILRDGHKVAQVSGIADGRFDALPLLSEEKEEEEEEEHKERIKNLVTKQE